MSDDRASRWSSSRSQNTLCRLCLPSQCLCERLMDSPSYLIVVAILEGRNFDSLDGLAPSDGAARPPELIFNARFLDEEILSDPIELTTANPPAFTELAWEVTRRGLHQFRVERKPIKLQAFLVDSESQEKFLIGYWVFDIRSAQESADLKFEWKPLLNPKFRGSSKHRPEILCALQLVRSDDCDAAEDSLTESPKSLSVSDGPSLLENDIQVREEDAQFRIWDSRLAHEVNCKQLVNLSIAFTSVTALQKLLPDDQQDMFSLPFHFQFSLFGKLFKTNGFKADPFQDKISVPDECIDMQLAVQSSRAVRTYFLLYPSIEVTLCQASHSLATATVPLNQIFTTGPSERVSGVFRLRRSDESETEAPHPTVGVRIQVEHLLPLENGQNNSTNDHSNSSHLRHFCFCIDIRNIRSIALSRATFYAQYLYATFGSMDKVMTSTVEVFTGKEEALTFKDGYHAFNFVSSRRALAQTFAEVPLLIELMQRSSKNSLTAISKLDLTSLLEGADGDEKKKELVMKPYFVDPHGENVAQLTAICSLQDVGPAEVNTSLLMQLQASQAPGKDSNLFEQLLVTAAVEVEVWKQQQKQKFQKKLLQSVKSRSKASSLELELRDCLERVKKHEAELEDQKTQVGRLEKDYLVRTEKLGDEISRAVLQVTSMYEARIEKERQTIHSLEEENKQMASEIASLKLKSRPTTRTQSLVRGNSVRDSNPPSRPLSRTRAASATFDASKPPLRHTRSKTPLSFPTTRWVPSKAPPECNTDRSAKKPAADRKASVLNDLKSEREALLMNGLCRSDDPMIKTIENELRRHGVRTK